jgi:hypothetical protein
LSKNGPSTNNVVRGRNKYYGQPLNCQPLSARIGRGERRQPPLSAKIPRLCCVSRHFAHYLFFVPHLVSATSKHGNYVPAHTLRTSAGPKENEPATSISPQVVTRCIGDEVPASALFGLPNRQNFAPLVRGLHQ